MPQGLSPSGSVKVARRARCQHSGRVVTPDPLGQRSGQLRLHPAPFRQLRQRPAPGLAHPAQAICPHHNPGRWLNFTLKVMPSLWDSWFATPTVALTRRVFPQLDPPTQLPHDEMPRLVGRRQSSGSRTPSNDRRAHVRAGPHFRSAASRRSGYYRTMELSTW